MKKLFCSVIVLATMVTCVHAATFTSCGAGYILAEHAKVDGIKAAECQKLWCRDLETGHVMGNGRAASSGYVDTPAPVELIDASGNRIECFGKRKWCSGEPAGNWNPEYGAYTRGGDDSTYKSYQKGGCFAWQLEKPDCADGLTAILQNHKWVCAKAEGGASINRASAVRRTGAVRRINK